ncbi:MAG TPA: hypothetical protein DD727_06895 [Clostridiales bacterium]|nr:hypothetical protein [Clostridiales bacterium]
MKSTIPGSSGNEKSPASGILKGAFLLFGHLWPVLAAAVAAELAIRFVLQAAGMTGLAFTLEDFRTAVSQKQLFAPVIRTLAPLAGPLALFMGLRLLSDLLVVPTAYKSLFSLASGDKEPEPASASANTPVPTAAGNIYFRFIKFRLFWLGLWAAFLAFAAIFLSTLIFFAIFLGDLSIPFLIICIAGFLFLAVAIPLRLSMLFPSVYLDGWHYDDGMKNSARITRPPYNYLRLLLIYALLLAAQLGLIWICPVSGHWTGIPWAVLTSIPAGALRMLSLCVTVTAYMQLRTPKPVDLNAVW